MEKRKIVIGDIHGCIRTFEALLLKCDIKKDDKIYLLGDYIDRGPDSKSVLDRILDMDENGYHIYPIRGNHEEMLLESLGSIESFMTWCYNGAEDTMKSFDIQYPSQLNPKYKQFLRSLEYYYELDDFLLVHGGLNFEIENPLEDKHLMVWQRNEYVDRSKIGGRRLIVGHTPKPVDEVVSSIDKDLIMLDGGCVYKGRYPGHGYLCALVLDKMELLIQENIDF